MSIYSRFDLVKKFSFDIELGLRDLLQVALELESDLKLRGAILQANNLLSKLDANQKIRVLTDPRIVSTVEAMHSHVFEYGLSGCSGRDWRRYLNVLMRIALSSLVIRKQSGEVVLFNEFESSYAVPGTSIYLCLSNEFQIQTGSLRIENGLIRNSNVAIQNLEIGSGIALASPEFALMPPLKQEHLLSKNEIDSQNWRTQIDRALMLLKLCPKSHDLVSTFGRLIVPMRDERPGIQSSVSFDCLPGAVFTSPCDQIEFLAETFVHESDHQRHYLLTRNIKVWNTPESQQAPIYRSPWRDDPRPLDGILRGGSAFVSVAAFWAEVDKQNDLIFGDSNWISSRVVYTNYQAMDALNIVNQNDDLTVDGQYLVTELIERAIKTRSALSSKANFKELVASAVTRQQIHNEKWLAEFPKLKENYNALSAREYLDLQL